MEVYMSPVVLRRGGVLLHLLCGFQEIKQRYILSWNRNWTGVKLCATVKKQTLGTRLSHYG